MTTSEFIVNVFSEEDNELRGTYRMNRGRDGEYDSEDVRIDWNRALDRARKDHPDEWNLTNVIDAMRDLGWTVDSFTTVEVAY